MNILIRLYYFFSRYTDPAERRVGRFFGRVSEKDSPQKIAKNLLRILQHDIAVVNLWTEHRYKGYDYLSKRTRKQLYQNVAAIQEDFASYAATNTARPEQLYALIAKKGVNTAALRASPEKLVHLATIMRYLSPAGGRYKYRSSSSFGRLLRDPKKEMLEGDCNQIVTLYIALYGTKYDINDLQLTVYPGHVALHFAGIDIEATNGTFMQYDKKGQSTAPIHEIVSINLLDTTDTNFSKSAVNPEVFLQAARLAYVVSSNRSLVKQNLEIAYHNTVRHMMQQHKYPQAVTYAKQSNDYELIEVAARNGAIYATKQGDFAGARRLARDSRSSKELQRSIDRAEAAQLYRDKNYLAAIKLFERLGERDWVQHSYRGLYVQEQTKLGTLKTVADVKAHAATIRTMERYAKRAGDAELLRSVKNLTKHL